MSVNTPSPATEPLPHNTVQPVGSSATPSSRADEIAAQVHREYARFLEKRDALRKETGRRRRTALLN